MFLSPQFVCPDLGVIENTCDKRNSFPPSFSYFFASRQISGQKVCWNHPVKDITVVNVGDVTQVLEAMKAGDAQAAGRLIALVYDELHRLAEQKMANESPGQTLQATALVHEAWLRLGGPDQPCWENRGHFYAAAAQAMRRILVDRARKRRAARHGGLMTRVDPEALEMEAGPAADDQLLAINDVLDKLKSVDPESAKLVDLKYFLGLKMNELAAELGISKREAERQWSFARAWLRIELEKAQNL